MTRPPFEGRAFSEHRLVEKRRHAQKKYPQSVWQLCGAGSVGSQALLGPPIMHHLLTAPALASRSRVRRA